MSSYFQPSKGSGGMYEKESYVRINLLVDYLENRIGEFSRLLLDIWLIKLNIIQLDIVLIRISGYLDTRDPAVSDVRSNCLSLQILLE